MQDLPGATNDELVGRGLSKATPITAAKGEEEGEGEEEALPDQPMKIAWRYQSKPKIQSSFSNQFGHSYDLTTNMPSSRIEAVEKICFNALEKPARHVCVPCIYVMSLFVIVVVRSAQELYVGLKLAIESAIHEHHFSVDEVIPKQVSYCYCCWLLFICLNPLVLEEYS